MEDAAHREKWSQYHNEGTEGTPLQERGACGTHLLEKKEGGSTQVPALTGMVGKGTGS